MIILFQFKILASASVIASASVDMSGLMYMYIIMSLPYMYSAYVCQFKIVWPVFLKAIASLCNKMGKVFSSLCSLTNSLLPPRVCFDKIWKEFENLLRQLAQLLDFLRR